MTKFIETKDGKLINVDYISSLYCDVDTSLVVNDKSHPLLRSYVVIDGEMKVEFLSIPAFLTSYDQEPEDRITKAIVERIHYEVMDEVMTCQGEVHSYENIKRYMSDAMDSIVRDRQARRESNF